MKRKSQCPVCRHKGSPCHRHEHAYCYRGCGSRKEAPGWCQKCTGSLKDSFPPGVPENVAWIVFLYTGCYEARVSREIWCTPAMSDTEVYLNMLCIMRETNSLQCRTSQRNVYTLLPVLKVGRLPYAPPIYVAATIFFKFFTDEKQSLAHRLDRARQFADAMSSKIIYLYNNSIFPRIPALKEWVELFGQMIQFHMKNSSSES